MHMGWMMTSGWIPYVDMYEIKPPGIFFTWAAVFTLTGQSIVVARIVMVIVALSSSVIVYWISLRFLPERWGVICAFSYLISMSLPIFSSMKAMADPFVNLFGLCGILLFLLFLEKEKKAILLIVGVVISISALFKPTGLFYLFAILIYFLLGSIRTKDGHGSYRLRTVIDYLMWIFIGYFIVLLPLILYYVHISHIYEFLYWSFTGIFSARGPPDREWQILFYPLANLLLIWILALITVIVEFYYYIRKRVYSKILLLCIICPLFLVQFSERQFPHYFIPVIGPSVILSFYFIYSHYNKIKGMFIFQGRSAARKTVTLIVIILLLILIPFQVFTLKTPIKNEMAKVDNNVEEKKLQEYIQSKTSSDEPILAFPYWGNVYFLCDRDPPDGYINHQLMTEDDESKLIKTLETKPVNYVITINGTESDFINKKNLNELWEHIEMHYFIEAKIGKYDIYRNNQSLAIKRTM